MEAGRTAPCLWCGYRLQSPGAEPVGVNEAEDGVIKRNLVRRLEDLETCAAPPGEPRVFQIVIVSSDGSKVDGDRIEWHPPAPRSCPRRSRWRYRSA
jgi:hypothetical protein